MNPFWRYYGGKWQMAPHYPAPAVWPIVEPFAGEAAGGYRQDRGWSMIASLHKAAGAAGNLDDLLDVLGS